MTQAAEQYLHEEEDGAKVICVEMDAYDDSTPLRKEGPDVAFALSLS